MSCERLRALLPQFDGRREDMASVLEMAVQFLRLTHTLVPGWEQHAVSCGCVDLVWQGWPSVAQGQCPLQLHASLHSLGWLRLLQGTLFKLFLLLFFPWEETCFPSPAE